MALAQFMNDWNDSFELKISVGDIRKPTQSFLFGVLEFFLGIIHSDCDNLKARMDERHYKIWVVKYFNDFFKTCHAECSILYGDLLKPDSKKIVEILRFLLNFHLFVKAVEKEVAETANDKIETYNQLLAKKNQLQLHQEEVKIKSQKKEMTLKECTRLIAAYKQSLEELQARSTLLTKDTDVATQQLHQTQEETIKLACERDELKGLGVTDAELNELLTSIKGVDNEISGLNIEGESIQSKNQCFAQGMSQITAELEELSTNVNEIGAVDSVEKCRDEMKNLSELKTKIEEFRNQIENGIAKRAEIIEGSKTLEAQLVNKRNELSSVLEKCQLKTVEMECGYKRSSINTANYAKKLEIAEQQVDELKFAQEQLIAMGIEVIEQIENS